MLPNITLLRSSCKGRLKYEVEYGLMRGSSDNSYVIRLPGKASAVLVDVPSVPYSALFLDALEAQLPLTQIKTIVVTHLSPQALPTLEKLMTRLLQQAPDATVTVVLTNPALRLLQTTLGEKADKAYLLTQMKLVSGEAGAPGGSGPPRVCTDPQAPCC